MSDRGIPRFLSLGQIVPVAMFGLLIGTAAMVLMFGTGQRAAQRTMVANAADAAAYSGAVWTARNLNFIAYANRAQLANHAAVGHFVSYVSWVRYIHDSIEYVDRVTQWIPYVGQYVDAVEEIAEQIREITERSAGIAIPSLDAWTSMLRAAQLETHASLAGAELEELMQRVAAVHDPAVRINDQQALATLPEEVAALVNTRLSAQRAVVPASVTRRESGADEGRLDELLRASLAEDQNLTRWISGERGWRENLIAAQIRKQGTTSRQQSRSRADWRASDQLQYRQRQLFGWSRWRRVGSQTSTASASEFSSRYAGVPAFYDIAGRPREASIPILAIATKRPARSSWEGDSATAPVISVAAAAKVGFKRPSVAFEPLRGDRGEYSNLFNPFWEAKLATAFED